MLLSEYNLYVALAINAFFTGIGTLLAQFLWSEIFKPRLNRWHKKAKRLLKKKK